MATRKTQKTSHDEQTIAPRPQGTAQAELAPPSSLNGDLRAILRQKLKAIATYDGYLSKCEQAGGQQRLELISTLKRDDARHVELALAELERLVSAGDY